MLKGFYFITDRALSKKNMLDDVKKAVKSKVCAVQYRDKNIDTGLMLETAFLLKKACKNIPLIINDRVDIALACKADGVHLGQDDMPVNIARRILGKNKIIGLTVHSLQEAEKGLYYKADYFGVSPVFATKTKVDSGKPVGLSLVSKIRAKCNIPIVAVGGIKLGNAQDVIASGADAISAISAVLRKKDVGIEINRFIEEINIGLSLRGVL